MAGEKMAVAPDARPPVQHSRVSCRGAAKQEKSLSLTRLWGIVVCIGRFSREVLGTLETSKRFGFAVVFPAADTHGAKVSRGRCPEACFSSLECIQCLHVQEEFHGLSGKLEWLV